MFRILKQVSGFPAQLGGAEHSGWLPPGAAKPPPTPIENALLDATIETDGHGYLLIYSARDGLRNGDSWHETLADAEEAAEYQLGIASSEWQVVDRA